MLRNPDYSLLQTDASDVGVGAVLSQGAEDQPVAYFSRRLFDRDEDSLIENGKRVPRHHAGCQGVRNLFSWKTVYFANRQQSLGMAKDP